MAQVKASAGGQAGKNGSDVLTAKFALPTIQVEEFGREEDGETFMAGLNSPHSDQ